MNNIQPANTAGSTRFLTFTTIGFMSLSPTLLLRNTPMISWSQKLRAMTEIFRGKNPNSEPTIAEWMSQRFGSGVVDNFVAPMCAGIYASTPEKISLPAAFPRLWEKARSGSILWQFIKQIITKSRPRQPRLTSFQGGTVELCTALEQYLKQNGAQILLQSPVQEITWDGESWSIQTNDQTIYSKRLSLTCPAPVQVRLLRTHFS